MSKTNIQLGTWKRCNIEGLYIASSLCGESHEFYYREKKFILSLPKKPKIKNKRSTSDDIDFSSWKVRNGRTFPIAYEVHTLDIVLDQQKTISVPTKSLENINPANLTNQQKTKYERLVIANESSILEAFEYWKLIMRWKTGKASIAPPYYSDNHHSRSAYLVDLSTRKSFYSGNLRIYAEFNQPISKRQWNKVKAALAAKKYPEIWEVFYIEAHHRRRVHDYQGAIISLAIAIE